MYNSITFVNFRLTIFSQIEKFLHELSDFNDRLNKMVEQMAELRAWMIPGTDKLEFITTTQELTPEDRVKEIFDLQGQVSTDNLDEKLIYFVTCIILLLLIIVLIIFEI